MSIILYCVFNIPVIMYGLALHQEMSETYALIDGPSAAELPFLWGVAVVLFLGLVILALLVWGAIRKWAPAAGWNRYLLYVVTVVAMVVVQVAYLSYLWMEYNAKIASM